MKLKLSAGYTKFTNIQLLPSISLFILDGVDISLMWLAWYITLEVYK